MLWKIAKIKTQWKYSVLQYTARKQWYLMCWTAFSDDHVARETADWHAVRIDQSTIVLTHAADTEQEISLPVKDLQQKRRLTIFSTVLYCSVHIHTTANRSHKYKFIKIQPVSNLLLTFRQLLLPSRERQSIACVRLLLVCITFVCMCMKVVYYCILGFSCWLHLFCC